MDKGYHLDRQPFPGYLRAIEQKVNNLVCLAFHIGRDMSLGILAGL
jgi:hypothetical protein